MNIDGACQCGNISYEATIDPNAIRLCHCTQCQVNSAAPFRTGVLVDKANFRLLSGVPKVYVKIAESGRPRALAFCAECGTSIYGADPVDDPPIFSLRIGTARQRAQLVPKVQLWARSAIPWLGQIAAMPKVDTQSGKPYVDPPA